ncbi:MAG: PilZ domain-containing protein [Desulfuromonadales bacterium]|nr:PilZ domain-containing protein [Desulfuromonadales bacterium]
MEEECDRPKADARKNFRAPLIIQKVLIAGSPTAFFGYSKNISKSGMFIATTNQIKAGEEIELEFQLPAPLIGTARCRCEVVWKRPMGSHLPFEPGMGMKFIDMPEEISEQISDWIKEQE